MLSLTDFWSFQNFDSKYIVGFEAYLRELVLFGQMAGVAGSCEQTWRDALQKCREKLGDSDYKLIIDFESPEKLMEEVAQLEARYARSVISGMLRASKPHLENLKTFSTLILFSIGCNVRSACFWGVTHLLIQVSVNMEQHHLRLTTWTTS